MQHSAQSRLAALQDVAVDVPTEELEEKRNGKLAALLLTKLAALAATPTGAIEAKRIAQEIENDLRRRQIDLARASNDLDHTYYPREHLVRDDPRPAEEEQRASPGIEVGDEVLALLFVHAAAFRPEYDSTVFDPEAQTRRALVDVRRPRSASAGNAPPAVGTKRPRVGRTSAPHRPAVPGPA